MTRVEELHYFARLLPDYTCIVTGDAMGAGHFNSSVAPDVTLSFIWEFISLVLQIFGSGFTSVLICNLFSFCALHYVCRRVIKGTKIGAELNGIYSKDRSCFLFTATYLDFNGSELLTLRYLLVNILICVKKFTSSSICL